MRRHAWQPKGLRGLHFYGQCPKCKLHRREKTGVAGTQVFEYSEDGAMFTTRAKVPPCEQAQDVVITKP